MGFDHPLLTLIIVASGFFLVGYGLWIMIAITMYRTALVIRPEHRQIRPGEVWYSLIPGMGIIFAIWAIHQLAISLCEQFNAIGERSNDEAYGMRGYQHDNLLRVGCVICILAILTGNNHLLLTTAIFALQSVVPFVVLIGYWRRIGNFKRRLEQHFSGTSLSQDERDFDEDISPRQEESSPQ
ncbi:hypothetical protein [Zavarzinella formosa]|uniref:hypothetical protein n=1 Tax=Zavarzinella formosa TaxID=360055 RepID=UPI00030450E3|nr:hypothetical protein [Zavarzinella formosa]